MSQPQFQPPQPQQPPQPPQYNPYAGGPAMPQQPPGAAPTAPPQMPMQPPMPPVQQGWPGQQPLPGFPMQPGQPQPKTGSPAGAIFLALLVSFLVTLLYAGGRAAAWQAITTNGAAIGVWALAILVNGATVGLVAGKVGGSGTGTRVGAVVVAVLGAFFSSANAAVGMVISVQGWSNFVWVWKNDPFFPAEAWWGIELHWLSVLGLVVAGGLAFVVALAAGRKRH